MDSTPDLVIFDCDGVLVDSEPIFSRAHADILSQCGYRITPQSVGERFCGISDAEMLAEIEQEWGRRLPGDYGDRVAAWIDASCEAALKALPGIHDALDRIPARICVASSSTPGGFAKASASSVCWTGSNRTSSAPPWWREENRPPICSCSRRGK